MTIFRRLVALLGFSLASSAHAEGGSFIQITWIGSSVIVGNPTGRDACVQAVREWNWGKSQFTSIGPTYYASVADNGDLSACAPYILPLNITRKPTAQEVFDRTWNPTGPRNSEDDR